MSSESDNQLADRVARCSYEHYENRISRRGKPRMDREWTLLASVVMAIRDRADKNTNYKVVAMGTGTKCIGQSKMSRNGDVLNDSHAEIITRRSFLRFLYEEIAIAYSGKESEVFTLQMPKAGNQCALKAGVSFHFFMSHTPCGDASILPMMSEDTFNCIGDVCINPEKPSDCTVNQHTTNQTTSDNEEPIAKRIKIDSLQRDKDTCNTSKLPPENKLANVTKDDVSVSEKSTNMTTEKSNYVMNDIFRTGAKCVPFGEQDELAPGFKYHCIKALRIKPGRGDRTISMSCSDKIARWNFLGCQGSLLSHFLFKPIYFNSFTIAKCPYSYDAVYRGLIGRFKDKLESISLPEGYIINTPNIVQSSLKFSDSRTNSKIIELQENQKIIPCNTSIIWYIHGTECTEEVAVNGRRQGVTSKSHDKPAAQLSISNKGLFAEFKRVLEISSRTNRVPLSLKSLLNCSSSPRTYYSYKMAATQYQEAWSQLTRGPLKTWIRKPTEYIQFT